MVKALDVIADDAFRDALIGTAVRFYASEEQEDVVTLGPTGDLALALAQRGAETVGLDFSGAMLEIAENRRQKIPKTQTPLLYDLFDRKSVNPIRSNRIVLNEK